MDANELAAVLKSEFWGEIKERLAVQKQEAVNDLMTMDFTQKNSPQIALKTQATLTAIEMLDNIIQEMKEEAMSENNEGVK